MADTQEIEQDEIDITEQKAKAIGKELGVVDDKPADDVPDFDIQEESDERIAKPRGEKPERKQLSNKEKRELRKKRINEKFNEKDGIIAAQQEELNNLKRRMSDVDNRLSGINQAEVNKAWEANIAAFKNAEVEHAAAFTEGDGIKATKSMQAMYDAQRNIEKLQGIKQQMEKQPAQQQSRQEQSRPDPSVVNKAKAWAEKNTWYNAGGVDVDSEIAKAISGVLVNEGYDPKSDDFWDELDDRLSDKQIGGIGDDEDEPAPKAVRKRSSPPVANGSNRGDLKGKKTITLPTSYINMLKANGIWDDVKRRNKVIAERERILRELNQ